MQDKIVAEMYLINPLKMWQSSDIWGAINKSKSDSLRNEEQIKFWKSLLPFNSETCVCSTTI
jgi:hypothetical protein